MGGVRGWVLCAALASAVGRKCSDTGENCKKTKCCSSRLMKCSDTGENCKKTKCCSSRLMACFQKNEFWAGCKESCSPGEDPLDPPKERTPWSCKLLGPQRTEREEKRRKSALPELPEIYLPPGVAPALWTPPCRTGVTKGTIGIGGLDSPTYAAGGGGRVQDPGIFLGHNSGYSILRSCMPEFSPDGFALFRLLGGKISFTVDLSRVGCGCNLAFYLTAQPARGRDGYFDPGRKGDYYCDANHVMSQWCPEVDIMEANSLVFAATPHRCARPTSLGHYTQCDRRGRGRSTRDLPGAYGPGRRHKIDTEWPFSVTTEFESADGVRLTGMRTVLRQEDRSVTLEHGKRGPAYLASLSRSMAEGMAVRISYWGKKPKTMAWLDEPPCSAHTFCNGTRAGMAVISGISVQGSLAPPLRQRPVATAQALDGQALAPAFAPSPSWELPWQASDVQGTAPAGLAPPAPVPLSGAAAPPIAGQVAAEGPAAFAGAPQVPLVAPVPPGQPSWAAAAAPAATVPAPAPAASRPFRFRPRLALAAAIAAASAAGLLLAALPGCRPRSLCLVGPPMPPLGGGGGASGPYMAGAPPAFGTFLGAEPGRDPSRPSRSYAETSGSFADSSTTSGFGGFPGFGNDPTASGYGAYGRPRF